MGFVTVLRTGLAYFLAHEIKDLEDTHVIRLERRNSESSGDLSPLFNEVRLIFFDLYIYEIY